MTNGIPIAGKPAVPYLLTASQTILTEDFVTPFQGSLVIAVACSPSAILQIRRNGTWYPWNSGNALNAGDEYDLQCPVDPNEDVNWGFTTGTTLTLWRSYYVQDM